MDIFDKGYYGPSGFYATNVFHDSRGRYIVVGWVRGFPSGQGWNGCLSLPRVLTLVRMDIPARLQYRNYSNYAANTSVFHRSGLMTSGTALREFREVRWKSQYALKLMDARRYGIRLRRVADDCHPLTISSDGETLDVDHVQIPLSRSANTRELELDVFVDRSVQEIVCDIPKIY